jgi:hypothetical protein
LQQLALLQVGPTNLIFQRFSKCAKKIIHFEIQKSIASRFNHGETFQEGRRDEGEQFFF